MLAPTMVPTSKGQELGPFAQAEHMHKTFFNLLLILSIYILLFPLQKSHISQAAQTYLLRGFKSDTVDFKPQHEI